MSQRPCFKTLDSYVTRSGKKVREGTRKVIREKTATLIAAAHLPYRFVEHQASGSLAMIHINYDVKIDVDTVCQMFIEKHPRSMQTCCIVTTPIVTSTIINNQLVIL